MIDDDYDLLLLWGLQNIIIIRFSSNNNNSFQIGRPPHASLSAIENPHTVS